MVITRWAEYLKRRLSGEFFLLAALIASGKLSSLLRDIGFSSQFGLSPQADAYFVSNGLPQIIFLAIYSTIFSFFLPKYIDTKQRFGRIAADAIASRYLVLYVLTSLVLCFVGYFAANSFVSLVGRSLGEEEKLLCEYLIVISCASFPLTAVVGLFSAVQQANDRAIDAQYAPTINNTLVFGGIVIFSASFGVIAVGYTAVVAWACVAIIQVFLAYRSGFRFSTRLLVFDKVIRGKGINLLVLVLLMSSVFIEQTNGVVGIYLAGAFGSGSISSISYSSKLMALFCTLVTIFVSSWLFPLLCKSASKGYDKTTIRITAHAVGDCLYFMLPMACILFLYSEEFVALIYARGGFDAKAVTATAQLFEIYVWCIPLFCLKDIFDKALLAQNKHYFYFGSTLIWLLMNVFLGFVLTKFFGLNGIPFGMLLALLICVLAQAKFSTGNSKLFRKNIFRRRHALMYGVFGCSAMTVSFLMHAFPDAGFVSAGLLFIVVLFAFHRFSVQFFPKKSNYLSILKRVL